MAGGTVSLAISVPGLTERANRYLSNPLQAAELTRAGIIAGAPPSIETVEQMGDAMRRFFMLTAIAATALATGQAAMADNRPDGPRPECRQNDRDCPRRCCRSPRQAGFPCRIHGFNSLS